MSKHTVEGMREFERAIGLLNERLYASALVGFAVARDRFRRGGDELRSAEASAKADEARAAMKARRERQIAGDE